MEVFSVPLLTVVSFYAGIAIQTYLDLLFDQRVRRENSSLCLMVLFGKSFLWPLVLLDLVRVNGLMTKSETAACNNSPIVAAEMVGGGTRKSQQARVEQAKEDVSEKVQNKNREKCRKRKRKRVKKK